MMKNTLLKSSLIMLFAAVILMCGCREGKVTPPAFTAATTASQESTASSAAQTTAASSATTPATTLPQYVSFADKALAAGVSRVLGSERILFSDAAAVTELDLSGSGIVNLSGIECFTSLKSLKLSDNGISDISSLSALTQLEKLYLDRNLIIDINPLAVLDKLSIIGLYNNCVKDASVLAQLPCLSYPDIALNPVLDYMPLISKIDVYAENYKKYVLPDGSEQAYADMRNDIYNSYTEQQSIIVTLEPFAAQLTGLTDIEKEFRIINYILDEAEYDFTRKTTTHSSLYLIFTRGRGVHNDYAAAFSYLASMAGLKNCKMYTEDNIWNAVCIDGTYYQLDLALADKGNYDYSVINISGESMSKKHGVPAINIWKYPEMTADCAPELQQQYYRG